MTNPDALGPTRAQLPPLPPAPTKPPGETYGDGWAAARRELGHREEEAYPERVRLAWAILNGHATPELAAALARNVMAEHQARQRIGAVVFPDLNKGQRAALDKAKAPPRPPGPPSP